MNITVIGYMKSHMDKKDIVVCNDNAPKMIEELKKFAGAEAGICYMRKQYFDSYVTNEEKALKRFSDIVKVGHQSIAGHSQVALLIEGIPKIVAMYLNNLTCYETSEKSGRYTNMTGNTEQEVELYEKWQRLFNKVIESTYHDKIDEKTREKLAKENARYLLSVFTPTTMGYTASLRQFNYIIDWCEKFDKLNMPTNWFFTELKKYIAELGSKLKSLLYVEELRDGKNRKGLNLIIWDKKVYNDLANAESFVKGKMYTKYYKMSFAGLGQAQRHRTLNYRMFFLGVPTTFYCPPIIKATEYEQEWYRDMYSLIDVVPMGTLIEVEEMGLIENFYLKSMERNCGRAQLEIMENNLATSKFFLENKADMTSYLVPDVLEYYQSDERKPKMKGQLIPCKEPCIWGCEQARYRKI